MAGMRAMRSHSQCFLFPLLCEMLVVQTKNETHQSWRTKASGQEKGLKSEGLQMD